MDTTKSTTPVVNVNDSVSFRALGTTYKVLCDGVEGTVGIVEHTLEPKSLGAPMHKHTREDEISYILEGELSTIQDGLIQTAGPGAYIVKPRNIFHTFWNAGDSRIRWIEIITPGNFQYYFAELAPLLAAGQPPQLDKVRATGAKYGLIVDPTAADEIIKQFGLRPLG